MLLIYSRVPFLDSTAAGRIADAQGGVPDPGQYRELVVRHGLAGSSLELAAVYRCGLGRGKSSSSCPRHLDPRLTNAASYGGGLGT